MTWLESYPRLATWNKNSAGTRFRTRRVGDIDLEDGGEGRNRTVDTTIFSRMLYQLSYLASNDAQPATVSALISGRARQVSQYLLAALRAARPLCEPATSTTDLRGRTNV